MCLAVAPVVGLAAARTAPGPGSPPHRESGDVEPVADLGARAEGQHRVAPFRAVPGADAGHQVAELVDQRREQLFGVAIEQPRIELDRAAGEVGPPGRGAQPAVEDDSQLAYPPAGSDPAAEIARQASERFRPATRRRAAPPSERQRSGERKVELDHSPPEVAAARTRSSVGASERPVCRQTIRPAESTTISVGRPRISSAVPTVSSESITTG